MPGRGAQGHLAAEVGEVGVPVAQGSVEQLVAGKTRRPSSELMWRRISGQLGRPVQNRPAVQEAKAQGLEEKWWPRRLPPISV
jgi:hypothetical protein